MNCDAVERLQNNLSRFSSLPLFFRIIFTPQFIHSLHYLQSDWMGFECLCRTQIRIFTFTSPVLTVCRALERTFSKEKRKEEEEENEAICKFKSFCGQMCSDRNNECQFCSTMFQRFICSSFFSTAETNEEKVAKCHISVRIVSDGNGKLTLIFLVGDPRSWHALNMPAFAD